MEGVAVPDFWIKTAVENGTPSWSQTYVYDQWGNRAVLVGSGVVETNCTPQTPNQTSVPFDTANRWSAGSGYDTVGNQNSVCGRTMGYDAENRQTSSTNSVNGSVSSYVYDGDGRRVKTVVNGAATVFVYDAFGMLAAEYGSATSGPALLYVTGDHLGSTRVATTAGGTVASRHDYLPFGEEVPSNWGPRTSGAGYGASSSIRQKFTGKERDTETGLDFFGARYFSGAQGRFTSPDAPFAAQHVDDPQSWNLYSYVRNNPLRYTDPTGRCLRPNETVESCGDYLLGGLMAVGNIPSGIINAPNHLANALISPFTDFQFPDAIPQTFTPSNEDQRQGMEAANVVMLVSPLAEAAAGKVAQVMGTVEAGAAATKTGVQANKVAGDAFRDQVASGLAAEGRGVQTEVYKKTPFGGRRIDIEVSDRPGGTVLGGIETKAGNSRYPAAQRAKDEYLRRQGYPVNVVREPKKR